MRFARALRARGVSCQWRTDVMQSWEYKVATVSDIALFEKMLNDRGTEGWELIAVRGAEWIFKRPK
jgi:hypothetical protein